MSDTKAILIACFVGAIALSAVILILGDLTSSDSYAANMTTSTRGNLSALGGRLNATMDKTVAMREKLNNTAVTQGDVTNNPFDVAGLSMVGVAVSTIQSLFDLPDTIITFLQIVINVLPFNMGYAIAGIAAIVGVIVVFEVIDTILRR